MKNKSARKSPRKAKQAGLAPELGGIHSILAPIDFSAPSRMALASAAAFADLFGAKITVLNVAELAATPDFVTSYPLILGKEEIGASCKCQLELAVKQAGIRPQVVEKTVVRFGRSFHQICEAARELKTDLIIIATHGYTGLEHALLGSTAERVVRHAPCPVLVVREREKEFV